MTVAELPVGELVSYGSLPREVRNYVCSPFSNLGELVWVKITNDNDFMLVSNDISIQMDTAEFSNSNRFCRMHGSRCFPETGLFKWLNARGRNWWSASTIHDERPTYHCANGFLDSFEDDGTSLEDIEMVCGVPEGFVKRLGGHQISVRCKVSILSVPQVEAFSYFRNPGNKYKEDSWTRSFNDNGMIAYGRYGSKYGIYPDRMRTVKPYIKLRRDISLYREDDNSIWYFGDDGFCFDSFSSILLTR